MPCTAHCLILCRNIRSLAGDKILRGIKSRPSDFDSADPTHAVAALQSAGLPKASSTFLGPGTGKQIQLGKICQKAPRGVGFCIQYQRASMDTMVSVSFVRLQASLAALLIALILK